MIPNPETWSLASVQHDSEKSPTYGIRLANEIRARELPRFVHGDLVSVAIWRYDNIWLVTGRASRESTIYIKRQELAVMGVRPPDSVRCFIVSVNGRHPVDGTELHVTSPEAPPESSPEAAAEQTATILDEQVSGMPENIDDVHE